MRSRNVFMSVITFAAAGCAADEAINLASTQQHAEAAGFTKSETKDGYKFTLSCGTPEGNPAPGGNAVVVFCKGTGSMKEATAAAYVANVKKFRDALNAAAPVLNKALEDAVAGAKPALKVACTLPPAAGDKPGIDTATCPQPYAGTTNFENNFPFQTYSIGAYLNDRGSGVKGWCEGSVDKDSWDKDPIRRTIRPPRWGKLEYGALAEWYCVVGGTADAINQTQIAKAGPLWINCPFPQANNGVKKFTCEQQGTSGVMLAAELNLRVTGTSVLVKFSDQLGFGIEFSNDSDSVFVLDGGVMKLRSGTKVEVSAKVAKITSQEHMIGFGKGGDYIGLFVAGGITDELSVATGAANSFTISKNMTQAELEEELRNRYALIAEIAATVASTAENRAKIEKVFKKAAVLIKQKPNNPNECAPTTDDQGGDTCERIPADGDVVSVSASDSTVPRDDIECPTDDDPTAGASATSCTPEPTPTPGTGSGSSPPEPTPTPGTGSGSSPPEPTPTPDTGSGSSPPEPTPTPDTGSGSSPPEPTPTPATGSGSSPPEPTPTPATGSGSAAHPVL